MRVAVLIMVVYITNSSMSIPQSSFSPFSLLGSFFGSSPVPSRPRQRPSLPRQRPRKRGQQGPRIILHPSLKVGPSISTPNFSASQPAPVRIKVEENPTNPPKKITHSQPRKSSQRQSDLNSFIRSNNVSSENSTLTDLKVTRKFISNKTSDIRSNPPTTETDNQVIENTSIHNTKNETSSHAASEVNKNDEAKQEDVIESELTTTRTFIIEPDNNTNIETSFFIPSEKIEKDYHYENDNHYDELLNPPSTHYTPQPFQYNTVPFIFEDSLQKSFSDNSIYENNRTSNQDVRFQIYPRGNIGSQRNQPSRIGSQRNQPAIITVNSPQITNKLTESQTLPLPQKTLSPQPTLPSSLPISQHYPRKKKHTVLSKQLVKSLRDEITENSFLYDTSVQQSKDGISLKPLGKSLKEDINVIKQEIVYPVFNAEVLPTPQKLQQVEFSNIAENFSRNNPKQITEYKEDEYERQDSVRGSHSRKRYLDEGNQNGSESFVQLVDCKAGSDMGFCPMSASYPKYAIQNIIKKCKTVIDSFLAEVPQDLNQLGENSISIGINKKEDTNSLDKSKPWSWKAYSYKKRQICDSELHFIKPGFAKDTKGVWHLIIQTENLHQQVAIDMCHSPGSPCRGLSDCGIKSNCIQRYNYQFLLAVEIMNDLTTYGDSACPTIRAFKFPMSCICQVETYHNSNSKQQQNLFFNKLTK